jgi:hypothetical protein
VTETLEKYGHGTPDDWLERNVYSGHSAAGIWLMMAIDLALFGPIGLTIWAVQMAWIPVTAAGIINGIGHYWGYRNFASEDASTNIFPWGILIGGEELHNNHHAYGTSARLSNKWYEFDIGWLYIKLMSYVGLAKVRKVAPTVKWQPAKPLCDLDILQAVITHRYDVLTRYIRATRGEYADEIEKLKASASLPQGWNLKNFRRWLLRERPNWRRLTRLNWKTCSARVSACRRCIACVRNSLRSGGDPPPAANSCWNSCRPGASVRKIAASSRCAISQFGCAATPDRLIRSIPGLVRGFFTSRNREASQTER